MDIALVGNAVLRAAIQRNLVSFPAQIPAFMKRGDMQERIVQLYFVRGWEISRICKHYGRSKATVRKLLMEWKVRAVAGGYIQEIHPELVANLVEDESLRKQDALERFESEPGTESDTEASFRIENQFSGIQDDVVSTLERY